MFAESGIVIQTRHPYIVLVDKQMQIVLLSNQVDQRQKSPPLKLVPQIAQDDMHLILHISAPTRCVP